MYGTRDFQIRTFDGNTYLREIEGNFENALARQPESKMFSLAKEKKWDIKISLHCAFKGATING